MRFMIIVRSQPDFESHRRPDADETVIAEMAAYHEELAQAGVLLDAAGLKPSARGWRIRHGAGGRTVVDGPFAESKELIAGYTLIQVRSREDALEWSRRFPNPAGGGRDAEIEVRELYELDDFIHAEQAGRFRQLGAL